MSRWIDAGAWWEAVQKRYTDGDCADDDRYELGINVGITVSRNVMMDVPSIDIVRCKECKYYKDEWCYWRDVEIRADDFCSYGEREGE